MNNDDITAFKQFLCDSGRSKDNRERCINFAQNITMGKGITYIRNDGKQFLDFLKHDKINIRTCDVPNLIERAEIWCPRSEDNKNGWAWTDALTN